MRYSLLTLLVGLMTVAPAPASAAELPAGSRTYIQVEGSRVYVERFGKGAAILFLHGGIHHFDNSFAEQAAYFASTREVIGIDRPGHGHSPDNGQPFTYEKMAEDTAAAIRQLGIGPVDVVGHSDGGDIGLILARRHPELVRRLIVSGANLRGGLSPEEAKRLATRSPAELTQAVHKLEGHLPPSFKPDFEAVTPDGAAQWDKFLLKSYILWEEPVVLEPAELKRIGIPVLVVAGDKDLISLEETLEIYRGLPKGELLIVPHSGHGTFSDRPALMNAAIAEFLGRP